MREVIGWEKITLDHLINSSFELTVNYDEKEVYYRVYSDFKNEGYFYFSFRRNFEDEYNVRGNNEDILEHEFNMIRNSIDKMVQRLFPMTKFEFDKSGIFVTAEFIDDPVIVINFRIKFRWL